MRIIRLYGLRWTAVALISVLAVLAVTAVIHAGSLTPPAAPGPSMRTLEELKPAWNKIIPADQRFVAVLDGNAVLDKETGLVWAKAPDTALRTWQGAIDYCAGLSLGGRMGWRLPTVEELASLVDPSASGSPALPAGHPFQNVQSNSYWSSSTNVANTSFARIVSMATGTMGSDDQSGSYYVWPVRAGH